MDSLRISWNFCNGRLTAKWSELADSQPLPFLAGLIVDKDLHLVTRTALGVPTSRWSRIRLLISRADTAKPAGI